MPEQKNLTPNTLEFTYENGILIPASLNFELIGGLRVHTEWSTNVHKEEIMGGNVNSTLSFVFEGYNSVDERRGYVENSAFYIIDTERGCEDFDPIDIMAGKKTVCYYCELALPIALNTINEWIYKRNKEIYDKYIKQKLMMVIIK